MNKKRLIIIISIAAAVLIAGGLAAFFIIKHNRENNEGNGKLVYVQKVSDIIGSGVGMTNRYMGIVESQEIKPVQKDADKTVGKVYVEEGDIVKKDDPLFEYDTESMQMELDSLKLELQSISNTIASLNATVKDLAAQRAEASDEDKKEYTAEINSTNAQIAEERYNYSVKEKEISRAEEAIKSSVVLSPMDGIIKSIKENPVDDGSDSGETGYINIMAAGEYRIKGTATEESITNITRDMPVIIHSRVDENVMWHGTVTSINLEPDSGNGDDMYGGGGDTSSKYSFYVEPENIDGLILGQHLYIEQDLGQGEVKEGLYLPAYFILMEEDGNYVWKKDEKDRIRKTPVTIGEYDEANDCYEITEGLTEDDYIAFPDVNVEEGNKTTTNYDEMLEQMGDDEGMPDGDIPEDMMMDDATLGDPEYDEYFDDGYMDDGYTDDYTDDGNVDNETDNGNDGE